MKKKNTIMLSLIVIILALSGYVLLNRSSVSQDSYGNKIIRAQLISASNPGYAPAAELYEGGLTFRDLNNFTKHTAMFCLSDWSVVKLNAVYDLNADYYVPVDPSTQSMETGGCQGPLKLSSNQSAW